jgi:hypothetical protein
MKRTVAELHKDCEAFLLDYANGKYGFVDKKIINKKSVETFMITAKPEDMVEVLSYTDEGIIKAMLEDKDGASDLEDWFEFVMNRDINY